MEVARPHKSQRLVMSECLAGNLSCMHAKDRKGDGIMGHTIALLNMKGGVGKTTLAVNLAWYMHQRERCNVLLIDLDPQFNATQYVMDYNAFDIHRKKNGTIADLLISQPKLSLGKTVPKRNPNKTLYRVSSSLADKRFDLLPAELNLAWVVKNPAQMENKLEKILSDLRPHYDYIFIDCAPTDSVLTTMALTASNFLLVPIRPDRFSILGSINLSETLATFRENCPDPNLVKDLGLVFTQVSGGSSAEDDAIKSIKSAASGENRYVFKAALKYSKSFIRAVKNQTPIYNTRYASAASRAAVGQVVKEMKERTAATLPPKPKAHEKQNK
jgi:chromosome partitioning protein